MNLESIAPRKWSMPCTVESSDQVLYLLQVVQAAQVVGPFRTENESAGALTETEADRLIKAIHEKLDHIDKQLA